MREILFKAKRINDGEWIEGCYLLSGGKHFIYTEYIEHYCMPVIIKAEIIPETLCWPTELPDKNGNDIWENDIVQYGAVAAVVKFGEYGNGNLGFYVDFPEKTNYRKDFSYWAKKVVVIGNAFDNQELLQEVLE